MCGIVGFFDPSCDPLSADAVVRRMATAVSHRGPDDEGAWIDPECGVALAHRRLAILDLSAAGRQPMVSVDHRYVLIFNGEIYNFAEIRSQLDVTTPHIWRGYSDTEILLAAIVQWGLRTALEKCVGMFAIALWDRQKRRLSLARDRIGEKPLYYGWLGKCFAFSSELKALRAHPGFQQEIDRSSVALLLRFSYVPAPYSIYKGVRKLRPGHILTLELDTRELHLDEYWDASAVARRGQEQPFTGTAIEATEHLDFMLRRSLAGQMLADVPIGAFLSGGIDSSTIVAVMQSMSSRPIETFTIGFDVEDYNEAGYAKKVATHLGTSHTELCITEQDALSIIPKLSSIFCEPFSDSSQIPTYLVSQLARRKVTVSLSGDGGDELFSGYDRYSVADGLWQKLSSVPLSFRRAVANLASLPSPLVYDRLATPLTKLLPASWRRGQIGDKIHKAAKLLSLQSVDDIYRKLCSHWEYPDEIVLNSSEPPTMLSGLEMLPSFSEPVRRMMYVDLRSYLPDDILVKVDRAAMANSLETRVPFLDHRLVEFASSLPLSILRADGTPKWLLRNLLHRHVPENLVDRPKMGFGVPIGHWLRGALREWAEDLLSEDRLRREGFLNPIPIRAVWQEHLSGSRNHQYLLWDVLMFQSWNK